MQCWSYCRHNMSHWRHWRGHCRNWKRHCRQILCGVVAMWYDIHIWIDNEGVIHTDLFQKAGKNGNFYFQAVLILVIVVDPSPSVWPTEWEDCVVWSLMMNLPPGWNFRILDKKKHPLFSTSLPQDWRISLNLWRVGVISTRLLETNFKKFLIFLENRF